MTVQGVTGFWREAGEVKIAQADVNAVGIAVGFG